MNFINGRGLEVVREQRRAGETERGPKGDRTAEGVNALSCVATFRRKSVRGNVPTMWPDFRAAKSGSASVRAGRKRNRGCLIPDRNATEMEGTKNFLSEPYAKGRDETPFTGRLL
ncbi:hypothetical protein AXG93_3218s1110 [Marchantia polymorpha subsp. ruderalis]|uniref:Uncharacterized protein n=1 Tax=Marchantia polymorpha subsp. ruderalis TaxID=1480154 RepID=A0A176WH80_MARPO|nr:hypothetical protein AXG93_3218s1110 [Marchantia polymorpha subsp. ruderalis]